MRSVDEIADELYTIPPAAFTAARDEAVARARSAGDPAGAKQLATFKRPTLGAYLVNLLALRRPELVGELVALGAEIRAAQGTVTAADLRDLTTRRRAAITAAVRASRELAAETGADEPTAAQLAEAEGTLAAAMADDSAAELVRAGRVVKALSYAGFGAGFGAAAPVKAAAPAAKRAPATTAGSVGTDRPAVPTEEPPPRARAQAARERLARAEAGFAAAQAQESAAHEELDRIAAEITRLRGALDTETHQALAARADRQAAERALNLARREVSTEEGKA
jgi:hypothetical protein